MSCWQDEHFRLAARLGYAQQSMSTVLMVPQQRIEIAIRQPFLWIMATSIALMDVKGVSSTRSFTYELSFSSFQRLQISTCGYVFSVFEQLPH